MRVTECIEYMYFVYTEYHVITRTVSYCWWVVTSINWVTELGTDVSWSFEECLR